MKDENNLPEIYKQDLPSIIKRKTPRLKELANKFGKCAAWGAVSLIGLGALELGGPVIATLGLGTFVVGSTKGIQNLVFRNFPDVMFCTGKSLLKNEITIGQDIMRMDLMNKIKNFDSLDKAAFMTLQTMVLLQRYKKEFEGTKKLPSKDDGINVYPKTFSTVTHGINTKTMKELEKLGYIQIENNLDEKQYKRNIFGKKTEYKKKLILARLGMGETEKVKEIIQAMIKGDKGKVEASKVVMKKVEFKLTDKPLDFEELYKLCNSDNTDDRKKVSRFRMIFDKDKGILRKQNIDIVQDKYGMSKILYTPHRNFLNGMKAWEEENKFNKSLECPEITSEKQQEVADNYRQKETIIVDQERGEEKQ